MGDWQKHYAAGTVIVLPTRVAGPCKRSQRSGAVGHKARGELVSDLKSLLEDEFGRVWVVGEISNLHRARSGHSYFTLKDDDAQIRAALFRGVAQRLPFDPEDGLEVVVFGDLTLYPSRGDLQIIVRGLEPRGQGALQLAFEQLRARLEAEGLFAPERGTKCLQKIVIYWFYR